MVQEKQVLGNWRCGDGVLSWERERKGRKRADIYTFWVLALGGGRDMHAIVFKAIPDRDRPSARRRIAAK